MKKLKINTPTNPKTIFRVITIIIIATIYFISIGFSSNSASARIENMMASVKPQTDVRITNVLVSGTTNNGISSAEDYNVNNIYGTVELPNADSTVTYKIDVTVFLSSEMIIKSITGLNENLEYELSDYTIGDILCDNNDQCNFGATKQFYLTIKYKENSYNSSNTTFPYKIDFTFESNNKIAKIGNRYFDTLQDAIDVVEKNNIETNIYLLNNTTESLDIKENQNIILNLQGNIVNNDKNWAVITNNGKLQVKGGSVTTNAATNGCINNESKGELILDSVTVLVSGGRQALYNNKGIATIKGNSYLYSSATERGAVQNVSGGTLTIESGKIYSSGTNGLVNAGTLYIGINDGIVDNESIEIIGKSSGVSASAKFNYYDGTIRGKSNAISDETKINVMETGYALKKSNETIDGVTYKTIILAEAWKVNFNSNGGSVSPTSKYIVKGEKIGTLPTPTKSGNVFLGWFTDKNNGTQINENYIVNQESTFYAHWRKNSETAQIGNTKYDTLQDAINAAPNNTLTTIQLLKDSSEIINVNANKKIVLDMGTSTLSNNGNNPVINNNGEIEIINGNITTNCNHACINQNAGLVTVNGTRIEAVGTRQAIYIYGGTVEVTGDSYLISETSGTPTGGTMERGTVQNLSPGTLIITGGTIIGDRQQAVSNEGSLTIGTKDGNIDNQFPLLVGGVCGVKSSVPFNFYDGAMKGKTTSHIGTIADQETSSTLVTYTEYYENELYYFAYLESN